MKKRLLISVTSDLVTDQRVHKVSQTLYEDGFDVLLVGRQLPTSLPLQQRDYKTLRLKLRFTRSALFYMSFNIRLFFELLFRKADVLLSNDLDTLPANFLVSVIKRIPLVYDSHEFYTGVPELQHRPFIRGIWERIEGFIFPRLRQAYTVNQSIARLYLEKYGKRLEVVRNVPYLQIVETAEPAYPAGKKIILYQGAGINMNRGAEELILSMQYLPAEEYSLSIVGGGDVLDQLQTLAAEHGLIDKVHFTGKVPFQELRDITRKAHLGISIDKPTNINYLYSLPNKVFDYIHAGLPVLCSDLPEIKAVVESYRTGTFIERHDPEHIAERIRFVFSDQQRYVQWRRNSLAAREQLCWQKEGRTVSALFHPFLDPVSSAAPK